MKGYKEMAFPNSVVIPSCYIYGVALLSLLICVFFSFLSFFVFVCEFVLSCCPLIYFHLMLMSNKDCCLKQRKGKDLLNISY